MTFNCTNHKTVLYTVYTVVMNDFLKGSLITGDILLRFGLMTFA